MTIGEFIKAERKKKKMSRQELSDKSGVCLATIVDWEHGVSSPNIRNADYVLRALGVTYTIGGE